MDDQQRRDSAWHALDVVIDPELDEPITDLGFVRSLDVTADGKAVLDRGCEFYNGTGDIRQTRRREQHLGVGVVDDERDLVRGEMPVDRCDVQAGTNCGPVDFVAFVGVLGEQRDDITLPKTEGE